MQKALRFSPQTRWLAFGEQCKVVRARLEAAVDRPETADQAIGEVLTYPQDAISRALDPPLRSSLSLLFSRHRSLLHHDIDEFGLRYQCIDSSRLSVSSISNRALFQLSLAKNRCPDWNSAVESRASTMTKGESALFLSVLPEGNARKRFFECGDGLETAEEFYYAVKAKEELKIPQLSSQVIMDLFVRLNAEQSALDSNFLANSLIRLKSNIDFPIKQKVMHRVVGEAVALSPNSLWNLMEAVARSSRGLRTENGIQEGVQAAVESLDFSDLDTKTLIGILNCMEAVSVTLSRDCRDRLHSNLQLRLQTVPLTTQARIAAILQSHGFSRDFSLLDSIRKEAEMDANADAFAYTLPSLLYTSNPSLTSLIPAIRVMSLDSLQRTSQTLQSAKIRSADVFEAVEQRAIGFMSNVMSQDEAMKCCEILGRMYHSSHVAHSAPTILAKVLVQRPEWLAEETVIAFAHQFSYIHFNRDINHLICEFLKSHHMDEIVADTVSSDDYYYYREGGKFHIPQNRCLSSKTRSQLAILIICLQRGRSMDPKMQEIIRQYIKCIVPLFPALTVKHRSTLVLGMSLRENFNVSLWNLVARAVNLLEQSTFNTQDAMRSLSVYRTAANNVKNLLRNIRNSCEWPVELMIHGEVLEHFPRPEKRS